MHLGEKRVLHRAHQDALQRCRIPDGTGSVHRWMLDNYADSILLGLRRTLDQNSRSFSLVKLLEELAKQHSVLTFDRYIELIGDSGTSEKSILPKLFWSRFSADGRNLDQTRIRADIKRLLADHRIVLTYIDRVVAHRQDIALGDPRESVGAEISWSDLDRLFDDVTELFNEYYSLVNPGVHVDFSPVLPAGYQRAFRLMMANDDS